MTDRQVPASEQDAARSVRPNQTRPLAPPPPPPGTSFSRSIKGLATPDDQDSAPPKPERKDG